VSAHPNLVSPFNPAKLLWHADKIALMQAGIPNTAPVSLEWDLSNTCPHDCPFCSFGTSESQGYRQQHWQTFPTDRAKTLIPELAAAGLRTITFTGGGEPLMHPAAHELMAQVSRTSIEWGLVTNGFLLRGQVALEVASHARFVRVSLDAGTQATHNLVHRPKSPQFELILENLAELVARARLERLDLGVPLVVGASFCVMDANVHELLTLVRRLSDIGVDYLEVRPTYPTEWRGDGWPGGLTDIAAARAELAKAQEYAGDGPFRVLGMVDRFDALESPEKGYSRCQIGPLTTVLGADGRLWHCCVQRGQDDFALGSVLDTTWARAWFDAQAKHLADTINVSRCPRCRYDNYNRLLAGVPGDAMHVNFV
jgi:MoaA/NifB/PqqE/SkfB family radical SAM enzyme